MLGCGEERQEVVDTLRALRCGGRGREGAACSGMSSSRDPCCRAHSRQQRDLAPRKGVLRAGLRLIPPSTLPLAPSSPSPLPLGLAPLLGPNRLWLGLCRRSLDTAFCLPPLPAPQRPRRGRGDAGAVHAAHQEAHGGVGVRDARGLRRVREAGAGATGCLPAGSSMGRLPSSHLARCCFRSGTHACLRLLSAATRLTMLAANVSNASSPVATAPPPPRRPSPWAFCTWPAAPWCAHPTGPASSTSRTCCRAAAAAARRRRRPRAARRRSR
jgi:hypothetical protein